MVAAAGAVVGEGAVELRCLLAEGAALAAAELLRAATEFSAKAPPIGIRATVPLPPVVGGSKAFT